jgi:hypothetical protein
MRTAHALHVVRIPAIARSNSRRGDLQVTLWQDRKAKCKHALDELELATHWAVCRLTSMLTHRDRPRPPLCELVGCCLYSDWPD